MHQKDIELAEYLIGPALLTREDMRKLVHVRTAADDFNKNLDAGA
jgi:hypothetical protein